MEEIKAFDEWLTSYTPTETRYYAIFDKKTGVVYAVYPDHSCAKIENKLLLDRDIADLLIEGTQPLNNFFIDVNKKTPKLFQKQSFKKLDNILYRIPDSKYLPFKRRTYDVTIKATKNDLRFSLAARYKKRTIKFDGDTVLQFLITDYNDVHKIHKVINFTIDELVASPKRIDFSFDLRYSIYTNRIFDTYIIK